MKNKECVSFIVYGKNWCSWCNKAKNLLSNRMIDFVYNDMDQMSKLDCENIKKQTGKYTIPIIFSVKNNVKNFIGGYDELKKYIDKYI